MAIISINDLHIYYGQTVAIKDVSIDIEKHDFIGIIGPNGGGKTTLIKSILGLLKPTKGSITIAPSERIGYVPQLTTFDRHFPITVKEVILQGLLQKKIRMYKRYNKEEREYAETIMGKLRIENLGNRQIGMLSGGQMQRVLIARAMMNQPTILILDEPLAGVDQESRKDIYNLLEGLNNQMTIIMVTHNTWETLKYLDRIIYINKTIHSHEATEKLTSKIEGIGTACPVDWFIQGEKINARFD